MAGNDMDHIDTDGARQAVADALRVVESGVRQREAQLATLRGDRETMRARLLDLKSAEFLQEAVAVSPRPVIGPLLVFFRRAIYHLFFKWQLRPLMQQQNRFNQAAARLLEDGAETDKRLAEELDSLRARVDELSAAGNAGGEQ